MGVTECPSMAAACDSELHGAYRRDHRYDWPRPSPCCRTRSFNMTPSVTMRMWHSVSSAFWRPDPRRGAEPREPSYADWTPRRDGLPRRFRLLDASRLRCGSACPRTDPSARLQRPWANPNVCTRMSSRLQKLSTGPLHELDAVMCAGRDCQELRNGPAGRCGPSLGRATVQRRGSRTAVALLPCCSVGYATPRRRWGPSLGRATVQRRGSRTAVALLHCCTVAAWATQRPAGGGCPSLARNLKLDGWLA